MDKKSYMDYLTDEKITMHVKGTHMYAMYKNIRLMIDEDQKGKDSGKGGFLYPPEVGMWLELLSCIAESIDKFVADKQNEIITEDCQPAE